MAPTHVRRRAPGSGDGEHPRRYSHIGNDYTARAPRWSAPRIVVERAASERREAAPVVGRFDSRRAPRRECAPMPRRLLLWLAVVLLGFAILAVARGGGRTRWSRLGDGIEFTTFRGDPWCRRGSSEIAALRLDPARVRLRVLHYSRQPDGLPLSIVEWQRRTGALAVFNAGQYYPDLSYMGLLVSNGEVISRRLHPRFKAALVASPRRGGHDAHVLDLDRQPIDPASPGWREVAQSFMLFDQQGEPRVRKTDLVANRTVVAEDQRGRLVVITSEGGYTLWDFANLLRRTPLGLTHAMAMDGGYEAELCVSAGRFHYASFGRWKGGSEMPDAPGASVPLPAVVAVLAP
jgi:hypothetical protein